MKYILTCSEKSEKIALEELKKYDKSFKFEKWLDVGVGLFESSLSSSRLKDLIINTPIVFTRHIFRIDKILDFNSKWQNEIILFANKNLSKNKSFSIQLRTSLQDIDKGKNVVTNLSQEIEKLGFILNVKESESVVSIYINGQDVYVGIDDTINNLNKYKGGERHFSTKYEFVSRAEYKLIEAIDVFNIDVSKIKTGADFGSSPGGWTKVLASKNIFVTAIDPANMDKKVLVLKNVEHKKMTIQEYFYNHNDIKFDIIVNDMKMDVQKSMEIMLNFYDKLNESGIMIMNFKLPKTCKLDFIQKCFKDLRKKFSTLWARQLFHNRNEITVVLKK